MKRTTFIIVIFCLIGMAVPAQDLSYYSREYMRPEGSFRSRLVLLETIRDAGITATGEFYHDALKYLLTRSPDIGFNRDEQQAAERAVVILCQGLGSAKRAEAANDLWRAIEFFDVFNSTTNEGNAMQSALIALADVDGRDYIPHIAQRLREYNTLTIRDTDTRRRFQTAVIGCVKALETYQSILGFSPVFFASVGSYDTDVREIASSALPNIAEDPGEVITAIIQDPSNNPAVKSEAWNQMLKTRAPDTSKAKVAAAALSISWIYTTQDRNMQERLRDMRKSSINTIRLYGVTDNGVYPNLDRTYSYNFSSVSTDYDEIMLTLNALGAIGSNESVNLLLRYLRELHSRRVTGPWGNKERRIFDWVLSCIAVTGTSSADVKLLLNTIQNTNNYTSQEKIWAKNASSALGF